MEEPTNELENITNFIKIKQKFSCKGYTVSIANFFITGKVQIQVLNPQNVCYITKNGKKMQMYVDKIFDSTGKQNLLFNLRKKLIFLTAERLHCKKIMFCDSAYDLAEKMINNIVLSLSINMSLEKYCIPNKKYLGIQFLYPMQNFTPNDIIVYSQFENNINIKYDTSIFKKCNNLSIQDITKKFILNLSFNNLVVLTICKISEKINFVNTSCTVNKYCVLCYRSLQIKLISKIISMEFAKSFSKFVSGSQNTGTNIVGNCRKILKKNLSMFIHDNFYTFNLKKYNLSFFICCSCYEMFVDTIM